MLSHFQPHFSNPRPDFAIRGAMARRARTMGRNERGARRACGSEAGRRAKGRRRSSGAPPTSGRALPHQEASPRQDRPFPIRGDMGKQENERKGEDGRGHRPQTCADRMRHRGRRAGRGARRAAGRGPAHSRNARSLTRSSRRLRRRPAASTSFCPTSPAATTRKAWRSGASGSPRSSCSSRTASAKAGWCLPGKAIRRSTASVFSWCSTKPPPTCAHWASTAPRSWTSSACCPPPR